jgi:tRNA U34 2-thiouridine synthase MnmA/TrmU
VDVRGNVLGKHEGLHYFTLGQRQGLGLSGGGAVYRDQGFHAKAHETLKKAIDLGLRDKHTFFNRAVAVMNMGKSKSAARFFEKAAELIPSPETWEAYFDPLGH